MPIHEKSLIRPENLKTHEKMTLDGVDVSGHWSTFIESRVVKDYNESLEDEIAALPGGENIHRCWQCGSCTNSCTVHATNRSASSARPHALRKTAKQRPAKMIPPITATTKYRTISKAATPV